MAQVVKSVCVWERGPQLLSHGSGGYSKEGVGLTRALRTHTWFIPSIFPYYI